MGKQQRNRRIQSRTSGCERAWDKAYIDAKRNGKTEKRAREIADGAVTATKHGQVPGVVR